MNVTEYGPFATVIAIVAALVASFSFILINAIGKLNKWTWLINDTPPFFIRYGAQGLAVALISLTFVLVDEGNYLFFAAIAALFGIGMIVFIARFDRLRRVHILRVPVTGADGNQATDSKGQLLYNNLVIGTEAKMRPNALEALNKARKKRPLLTPVDFLSGVDPPYNVGSVWDQEYLADVSNRLTISLLGVVLCGVLALYLAASSVEMATREPGVEGQPTIPVSQ